MDEASYQDNFPLGAPLPEPIRALLSFQRKSKEWYSGYFQLAQWRYGNAAWFAGDSEAAKQFIILGRGPDGSLYAMWLYAGRTLADAPVVFLGSEGTDSGVIACDLRQFLSLLAVGADELGFAVSWGSIEEAKPPAPRLAEFRMWLQATYGIDPPIDPLNSLRVCTSKHPDFEEWLQKWQASRQ